MSHTRPLKAGVIGLGVGEQHLIGYKNCPDVDVVAICDLDQAKLLEVGKRHTITELYTDAHKITDHPDLDVISICSYDNFHAEHCLRAFENGKHVMVEKPICLYRHEAEQILKAQQDSGRLLTSNLILRQSPRFRELRSQIQAGDFGDIFCIESGYIHNILWKITEGWRGKMPYYSTVFGGGIHLIDLMRWLLSDEITQICGMGNNILSRGTSYPYDDSFLHVLSFSKGTIGKCLTTFGPARTKFHELTVYGTTKTFENDLPFAKSFTGDQDKDQSLVKTPYPGIEKGDLLSDFICSIRESRKPIVNENDVFRVMDVCFAAMESLEKRRTIDVAYMI